MNTTTTTRKSAQAHPGTVWKKDIESKGLTRLQVAKAMGVAPMSLHRVCEAEGIPSAEMSVRYARATGQEEATVWEAVQAYALQVALGKVPALDVAVAKEKAPAKTAEGKKATTKGKAPAKGKATTEAPATGDAKAKGKGTKKTGNPQEDRKSSTTTYVVRGEDGQVLDSRNSGTMAYTHAVVGAEGAYSWHLTEKAAQDASPKITWATTWVAPVEAHPGGKASVLRRLEAEGREATEATA